jgi:hypothetical protein
MIKAVSFSVQMVEIVFKRLNFNSNEPITRRHVTAACRPQRQMVVRAVPSSATARPDSNVGGIAWSGQAPAPPSGPAATSSTTGGSAR